VFFTVKASPVNYRFIPKSSVQPVPHMPALPLVQIVAFRLVTFFDTSSSGTLDTATIRLVRADFGNTLLILSRKTCRPGCDTLLRTVPKWSVQSASGQSSDAGFRMGVQG
jgi:hypothetical protein